MENADAIQTAPTQAPSSNSSNPVPAPDQNKDKPAIISVAAKVPNIKFPVPTFYFEDRELWFWQQESTFVVNKITTQKGMYSCVVSNLPYKIIRQIPRDLLSKLDPYTAIKNLVVKETNMSDYQRSKKLPGVEVPDMVAEAGIGLEKLLEELNKERHRRPRPGSGSTDPNESGSDRIRIRSTSLLFSRFPLKLNTL